MSDASAPLYSRRLFLSRGVQLLSAAGTLPLFLDTSARCLAADFAANPQGAGRPDRVLVVVQLAGGNDGLNTVVPVTNDDYYKARPNLAIARDTALRLNDEFALHPSAAGFKRLYDDGLLGIVHGMGYPNPNRSHFRATDIWASAEPERAVRSGWIGRYFDACCNGQDPGKAPMTTAEPSSAVALTNEPPQALEGEKFLPIAFRSPDSLSHRATARNNRLAGAFNTLNDDADELTGGGDEPAMVKPRKAAVKGTAANADNDEADEFLQRSALNARVYADQIKKTTAAVQNQATYPGTRLANDLKLVAQMIAAGLPTRVYYVQLGGFDTHANQALRHVRLMDELTGAVAAFVDDLKALGHLDRTTLMTFSEFGRRVAENNSAGTDHGEAAPMFVVGPAIQPGFHGKFPDLAPAKLHRGDVPYTTDFRRVYAGVLRDWLKADDVKVLGKRFEPLKLFKPVHS